MQSHFSLVLTSGLAMFAMFFGSGNLVFPLAIGAATTSNSIYSILGLALTGVCVPFLGLLAMIAYNGKRESAFSHIGKWPSFLLSFAMLSLMGPFGVAARCIIVAHGGIVQLFPGTPLWIFGIAWSVLTGLIILRQESWINVIGRYLTPILLLSIGFIVVAGFLYAPPLSTSILLESAAFTIGLDQGYQTMDLLAAFFFSVTIINYLHKNLPKMSVRNVLRISLMSSAIGAGLLLLVYIGFVLLGALYSESLLPISPEQRLAFIANHTLGNTAMLIVATTVALACLTTFVVLIVLFAQFLTTEISQERLSYKWSVITTLILSYTMSLLGFNTLATWIAHALQITYPALIAFSAALILHKVFKINIITFAFWGSLAATIITQALQQ